MKEFAENVRSEISSTCLTLQENVQMPELVVQVPGDFGRERKRGLETLIKPSRQEVIL